MSKYHRTTFNIPEAEYNLLIGYCTAKGITAVKGVTFAIRDFCGKEAIRMVKDDALQMTPEQFDKFADSIEKLFKDTEEKTRRVDNNIAAIADHVTSRVNELAERQSEILAAQSEIRGKITTIQQAIEKRRR